MKKILWIFLMTKIIFAYELNIDYYNAQLKGMLKEKPLKLKKVELYKEKEYQYIEKMKDYFDSYYAYYLYYQKVLEKVESYKETIFEFLLIPKEVQIKLSTKNNHDLYYEIEYKFEIYFDFDKLRLIKGDLE